MMSVLSCGLDSLPDEVLHHSGLCLQVVDLGSLTTCSRRCAHFFSCPDFILACTRTWNLDIFHSGWHLMTRLDHLAVHVAVSSVAMSRPQLYTTTGHDTHPLRKGLFVEFEGLSDEIRQSSDTSSRSSSHRVFDVVSEILQRHPSLGCAVEAHTGRFAPSSIATEFTLDRARTVVHELCGGKRGVSRNAIEARGWGKTLAIAELWQPGKASAMAELFLFFETNQTGRDKRLYFPARPSCYEANISSAIILEDQGPDDGRDRDGSIFFN